MWEKIIDMAVNNGIWALLFCSLFIFELKDNKTRENKYQNTIQALSDSIGYVKNIDESLGDIRNELRRKLEK